MTCIECKIEFCIGCDQPLKRGGVSNQIDIFYLFDKNQKPTFLNHKLFSCKF